MNELILFLHAVVDVKPDLEFFNEGGWLQKLFISSAFSLSSSHKALQGFYDHHPSFIL